MDNTPSNPLDDFLNADYSSPEVSALKQRLLVETTVYVRSRRRRRRAALVAGWVASFALGALAMLWWRALPPPSSGLAQNNLARESSQPMPPEEIAPPTSEAFALAKEWEAFDSTKNRAALFFEAGDRYLAESNDMQSALRCYRQALDASTARELAISANDNWLVTVLKESRQKERNHAQAND